MLLLSRAKRGIFNTYAETPLVLVGGLSRSGTTLLSAVLDAHPDIAAGAELIPVRNVQICALAADIERANALTDDFSIAGKKLRADGANGEHASLLTRCHRAGLTSDDVASVVAEFLEAGLSSLHNFKECIFFAVALISKRMSRENAEFGSFKLNTLSVTKALGWLPRTFVVALVRNPTNVVESHIRNRFPKTVEQVSAAWVRYVREFQVAEACYPDRMFCIRYEDFVASPQAVLESLFERLPLGMREETLKFHQVDSSILRSRHPNTERLKEGFSVDTGQGHMLDPDQMGTVRRICGTEMQHWGYE